MILARTSLFRSLALAATSLALTLPAVTGFAGNALADDAPTPVAAEARTHAGAPVNTSGEVARYVTGPLGHVRAFILKDGTAVKVRETEGDTMARQVRIGETVRIEGWSPAASSGKAIFRASVYGQHGVVFTAAPRGERPRDPGARKAKWGEMRAEVAKLPEASANGTVETVVMGRRGRPMALVLTDGTSVFLRGSLARQVMTRGVRAGDRIQAAGKGATYPTGPSVVVKSITFADGTTFQAKSHRRAAEG